MARKLEVVWRKMLAAPEGYDIVISLTDGYNFMQDVEIATNIPYGSSASTYNASIVSAAKDWAAANWGTAFGLLDTVVLMNAFTFLEL